MNNSFSSFYFAQKIKQKNVPTRFTIDGEYNYKTPISRIKKAPTYRSSNNLKAVLLYSYKTIEFSLFKNENSLNVSQNTFSLLFEGFLYKVSGFVFSSDIFYNTKPVSNVLLDPFSFFFASQLGYNSQSYSTLFSNASSFFTSYSTYFRSNSFKASLSTFSKNDRFFYQTAVASFFFTNTFFGGSSRVFTSFSLLSQQNFQKELSRRVKPSTILLSSTFVRRHIRQKNFKNVYVKKQFKTVSSFVIRLWRRQKFNKNVFRKGGDYLSTGKPETEQHKLQLPVTSRWALAPFERTRSRAVKRKPIRVKIRRINYFIKAKKNLRRKKRKGLSSKNSKLILRENQTHQQTAFFKLYPTTYQEAFLNPNILNQLKALLSIITHSRFSFYQINAVSLSRFAFDQERRDSKAFQLAENKNNSITKAKLSQRYLFSLERERTSRFRYVAIFIKDLIRVSFFSRYLKKANFLASFYAFTLSKLPRNRKETKFLRFLRKLLKVFASQRKERVGARIRFQGRVNRWRRTKHRIGEKGSISFLSYNTRIDYGRAQAITRKGARGIRIWLAYNPFPFSSKLLRNSIFNYTALSSAKRFHRNNDGLQNNRFRERTPNFKSPSGVKTLKVKK